MALRQCRDCGSPVSTSAKTCPKCGGKPPKQSSIGCTGVIIILAVMGAIGGLLGEKPPKTTTPTATAKTPPALLLPEKKLTNLSPPFSEPFQYLGMKTTEASLKLGAKPNPVSNIIVDSNLAHLLLETRDSYISFVNIDLIETEPCHPEREFNSPPVLSALGIDSRSLELARKQIHYHTYYDHQRKMKVGVSCLYEGAPINVSFSKKYYLN